MWKCTGSWSSAHTSQSGSQARLARSGEPRSCGSEVMLTPRSPRRGAALRLAHADVDVPRRHERHRAGSRLPELRLHLGHARRCRSRRRACAARSSCTMLPRFLPPRPIVFGKITCAWMPHSSMTSSRASGRRPPRAPGRCPLSIELERTGSCSRRLATTPPPLAKPRSTPSTTQVGDPVDAARRAARGP